MSMNRRSSEILERAREEGLVHLARIREMLEEELKEMGMELTADPGPDAADSESVSE